MPSALVSFPCLRRSKIEGMESSVKAILTEEKVRVFLYKLHACLTVDCADAGKLAMILLVSHTKPTSVVVTNPL